MTLPRFDPHHTSPHDYVHQLLSLQRPPRSFNVLRVRPMGTSGADTLARGGIPRDHSLIHEMRAEEEIASYY